MANVEVKLEAHFALWWIWYVRALLFVAAASHREPDWDKFGAVTQRAIRIRVKQA